MFGGFHAEVDPNRRSGLDHERNLRPDKLITLCTSSWNATFRVSTFGIARRERTSSETGKMQDRNEPHRPT